MTGLPELTLDGEVARITLDRPDTRNALTLEDISTLTAHLDTAARAPVRALVLTGAGERAFSGGADLSSVGAPGDWAENPLTALCDRLECFRRPTIARLNGAVIGGAVELSLSCDFRIGVEGMKLMVPAARIGLHYEASGLTRAAACIGWQAARRVYMLGESFSDNQLENMGYLDRLAPREGLDQAVGDMLAAILGAAPLAVDGMKRTLLDYSRGRPDPVAAGARVRETWLSEDLQEGLAAIREKRPPRFRGR